MVVFLSRSKRESEVRFQKRTEHSHELTCRISGTNGTRLVFWGLPAASGDLLSNSIIRRESRTESYPRKQTEKVGLILQSFPPLIYLYASHTSLSLSVSLCCSLLRPTSLSVYLVMSGTRKCLGQAKLPNQIFESLKKQENK